MSTCILHKKTQLQTCFLGGFSPEFFRGPKLPSTWGEMTIPYTLENLNIYRTPNFEIQTSPFSSAARKNGPLLNHVWRSLIMTTQFRKFFSTAHFGSISPPSSWVMNRSMTACDSRFCKRLHSQRARSRSSWMVPTCEFSVRHVTPTSLEGANRWESIRLRCISLCSTWVAQHYVHK